MAKIHGKNVLVNVNTGTAEVPVWTAVGCQREASIERNNETIDTTSKDSNGWDEKEYGNSNWSIEFGGLVSTTDTGYDELEEAFMNKTKILIQFKGITGKTYEGLACITSAPIEAPQDDYVTYSFSCEGSGALVQKA